MKTRKNPEKNSWFNIFSSVRKAKESYYPEHPYHADMGGLYRVFAGRVNKPATNKGHYGFMFGEEYTIRRHESENHAGIYDFMTLGIPWAIESSFRGNWIDRKGPRTACQMVFSPLWVPLSLARATFGTAVMSAVIVPASIYHFASKPNVTDKQKQKEKHHDFSWQLQSLNKIEKKADYWEVKKESTLCHPVLHKKGKKNHTPQYYKIISNVKKDELPESLHSLVQDKKSYRHYVKVTDGKKGSHHLHIWKRVATKEDEKVSKKCAYVPPSR